MSTALRRAPHDLAAAFQFLTRLPVPQPAFDSGTLARAVKFFPLVGAAIGIGAALLHRLLLPHLGGNVTAWSIMLYLVLVTGCLHEDALADVADSFGAWTRERRIEIMRDSRIGSYGAAALVLSLSAACFHLRRSATALRRLHDRGAATLPMVDPADKLCSTRCTHRTGQRQDKAPASHSSPQDPLWSQVRSSAHL